MTRHLEYAVELAGIDHVGVSTDFSFVFGARAEIELSTPCGARDAPRNDGGGSQLHPSSGHRARYALARKRFALVAAVMLPPHDKRHGRSAESGPFAFRRGRIRRC